MLLKFILFKSFCLVPCKSFNDGFNFTIALTTDNQLFSSDHNRIHAADVLHGVYYLTKHKIPGFNAHVVMNLLKEDLTLENDISDDDYGYMGDVMPELELMALYTAAAMHDFDHPGRTNAFLVTTSNPKVST